MTQHSESFKSKMVQRMVGPAAISANPLAHEIGIGQPTLSKWLRDAGGRMGDVKFDSPPPSSGSPRRPEDWSPEERLRAVMEASRLTDEELGAFLRREGISEAVLAEWKTAMLEALSSQRKATGDARKVRELEKQLPAKTRPWQKRLPSWYCKENPNHLGGRGQRHQAEERRMVLQLIDEAVQNGARREKASALLGLSARTLARWRVEGQTGDPRCGPRASPAHKLTEPERELVLAAANRPEYRNLSPRQIVPLLADRGEYIASESTFYRVLREAGQLAHRQHSRPARRHRPKEHVARVLPRLVADPRSASA